MFFALLKVYLSYLLYKSDLSVLFPIQLKIFRKHSILFLFQPKLFNNIHHIERLISKSIFEKFEFVGEDTFRNMNEILVIVITAQLGFLFNISTASLRYLETTMAHWKIVVRVYNNNHFCHFLRSL